MKAEKYRFSIVIPCYNEADFIAGTLDSLKNQDTTQKYEIIVVDNNCTDETVAIAKKYAARVITEKNAGVCWARQAGTQAAKGEIIVSTDADTTFPSDWLSNIDRSLSDKRLVAVGGPCLYSDGPWWGRVYTHFVFTGSYIYYLLTGHPFYITATNIAFRKSAWSGYDLTSMQGGDELSLLHSLRTNGKVRFINSNSTYTSGRRLTQGLLYNIFVTFLFYYLGAYYINKIFRRTIVGSAPAFREVGTVQPAQVFSAGFSSFLIFLFIVIMATLSLQKFSSDNIKDTSTAIKDIWRVLV